MNSYSSRTAAPASLPSSLDFFTRPKRPLHCTGMASVTGIAGGTIFVLDTSDSFTYTLVQYIGELGERVEVRRNDQVTVKEVADLQPEKIVVSPAPGTPHDAGISIDLIRHFAGKVPVLGVCL